MSSSYNIPARRTEIEEVFRRSRFVTSLGRAANRAAALAFVQETRERHPRATHHCWAFNAGSPGSSAHVGMSDDGEPRGTAGRPMLTVLLSSDVGEVVAACARYYGGTKLGTGGLARAYASGVKQALAACVRAEKADNVPLRVLVGYDARARVERTFKALGATIANREFAATVRYRLLVPRGRRSELAAAVADATAGRALVARDSVRDIERVDG